MLLFIVKLSQILCASSTYPSELLNRTVRCPAFLALKSDDMFVRTLLSHDFWPRLGSIGCEIVVFRIACNVRLITSKLSRDIMVAMGPQTVSYLTLELKIVHLPEAVVKVVLMVERKPLGVRWRYKKLACCMITICKYLVEIVPVKNKKNFRY